MPQNQATQQVRTEVVTSLDAEISQIYDEIDALLNLEVINSDDLTMVGKEVLLKCTKARTYVRVLNSINRAEA